MKKSEDLTMGKLRRRGWDAHLSFGNRKLMFTAYAPACTAAMTSVRVIM